MAFDPVITQGYINLISAVINLARKDAKGATKLRNYEETSIRGSAVRFLQSEQCAEWLEMIEEWNNFKAQARSNYTIGRMKK